jgi:GNAT superfamily N-acetyltransferase
MPDKVNIHCVRVDYTDTTHMDHLIYMLNHYAMDPMGGGSQLTEDAKLRLRVELKNQHGAMSYLAYKGNDATTPVGLINCFPGYSSFKARPLLNIHDVVVHSDYRGKGIGTLLIEAVEMEAKTAGYCKLTLEVRTDNIAKQLYRRLGFGDGGHPMWFLTKEL